MRGVKCLKLYRDYYKYFQLPRITLGISSRLVCKIQSEFSKKKVAKCEDRAARMYSKRLSGSYLFSRDEPVVILYSVRRSAGRLNRNVRTSSSTLIDISLGTCREDNLFRDP